MNKHIKDLMSFLDNSPTSIQAVQQIAARLQAKGFEELDENQSWKLNGGGKYYVNRDDAAVVAFRIGSGSAVEGLHVAGAHLDSPSLKIKPGSEKRHGNFAQVSVEVYGSPILATWFDRSLGLAGRVVWKDKGAKKAAKTHISPVNISRPVAIIPNAALHVNRKVNEGFEYNKQNHLQAIIGDCETAAGESVLKNLVAGELRIRADHIINMELFLYETTKAELSGADQSLLVSARQDDQTMSHAILSAMLEVSRPSKTAIAVFYDHEEIGSMTRQGAFSTFLSGIMERMMLALGLDREQQLIALRNSYLVSGDMAHAFLPAFADKYDPDYAPKINQGIVIKSNINHNYATTLASKQRFINLCEKAGVSWQEFLTRSDVPCGSTIGPIAEALNGVMTIDIGSPMWAMHSIRETSGVNDHLALIKILTEYYKQ